MTAKHYDYREKNKQSEQKQTDQRQKEITMGGKIYFYFLAHILNISSALLRVVSVILVPPMILASSFFRPSMSRGVTVV